MRRAFLLVGAALWLCAAPAAGAEPLDDLWGEVLRARVNMDGEVAYRSIATWDRERLTRYVTSLRAVEPGEMSRDDALAFWINAYNALVVFAVIHGESPETVESRARLYHWFPVEIAGASRTLDEIHAILARYAAGDPRIHFVLCNGGRSAPRLAAEPLEGKRLDAQLAAAARRFVTDEARNRFDAVKGRAEVSSLFDWYRGDFERTGGSLTAWLAKRVSQRDAARLLSDGKMEVSFLAFDWTLNAASKERPF